MLEKIKHLEPFAKAMLSVAAVLLAICSALLAGIVMSPVSAAPLPDKDLLPEVVEEQYDIFISPKSFSYAAPEVDDEGKVTIAHAMLSVDIFVPEVSEEEIGIEYAVIDGEGNEIGRLSASAMPNEKRFSIVCEGDIAPDKATKVHAVRFKGAGNSIATSNVPEGLSGQIREAADSWGALAADAETAWVEEKAVEQARATAASRASGIPSYTGSGSYGDVLMIGDSVMVVSSWSLKDALPGVTIDAVSGRSLETGGPGEGGGSGDGVLDHVRACDRSFSRYVIGTGNNDGLGMDLESAEEIISLLPGKQIWFVTEYVSNNSRGTANTNATIDAVCSKYPNVHKADWHAVVTANESAFLQGDNCHPQTRQATDAYASVIAMALDER